MSEQRKNYVYSLEVGTMSAAVLIMGAVLLLPLFIFRRDIIITAGQNPFFIIGIAFWLILHEIIHGLSYRLSKGVSGQDIAFGVKLEKGVLFCVCKKPIAKNDIIRSLLAPFVIIGILTLIIGFVFDFALLIMLSLINICGAMGDILMTLFIIRMPEDMMYFEDDQNRFVINTSTDISSRKVLGVKLEEVKDDSEKPALNSSKKITVSKASVLILAVISAYTVLSLLEVF